MQRNITGIINLEKEILKLIKIISIINEEIFNVVLDLKYLCNMQVFRKYRSNSLSF